MKRSIPCAALAALLLFAAGAPVQAASTLVDPWQSSGNGTILNDNFGTVPNMDLLYGGTDALGSSTPTGRMYVWALWGTLYHVAYTDQAVADIFLRPDAGWSEGSRSTASTSGPISALPRPARCGSTTATTRRCCSRTC